MCAYWSLPCARIRRNTPHNGGRLVRYHGDGVLSGSSMECTRAYPLLLCIP